MNQLIDVTALTPEEIQLIQTQLINHQLATYQKRIETLENEQNKLRTEMSIAAQTAETQLELERKRHRAEVHRYGYISLSDLGQMYTVSIGSVTMGKLLRMAGIAKEKMSRTEPYREFITGGYAKSEMYGDNVTYKFNPEKCVAKIDRWLESEGIINEFYSFDDEKKLHAYIGTLAEKYLK